MKNLIYINFSLNFKAYQIILDLKLIKLNANNFNIKATIETTI